MSYQSRKTEIEAAGGTAEEKATRWLAPLQLKSGGGAAQVVRSERPPRDGQQVVGLSIGEGEALAGILDRHPDPAKATALDGFPIKARKALSFIFPDSWSPSYLWTDGADRTQALDGIFANDNLLSVVGALSTSVRIRFDPKDFLSMVVIPERGETGKAGCAQPARNFLDAFATDMAFRLHLNNRLYLDAVPIAKDDYNPKATDKARAACDASLKELGRACGALDCGYFAFALGNDNDSKAASWMREIYVETARGDKPYPVQSLALLARRLPSAALAHLEDTARFSG